MPISVIKENRELLEVYLGEYHQMGNLLQGIVHLCTQFIYQHGSVVLVTASAEMSPCLEVISWGHREREREWRRGQGRNREGKEGINLIKNIFRACLLICMVLGLGSAVEHGVEGKKKNQGCWGFLKLIKKKISTLFMFRKINPHFLSLKTIQLFTDSFTVK